jgi:hypothetical protein
MKSRVAVQFPVQGVNSMGHPKWDNSHWDIIALSLSFVTQD